VSPSKTNSRMSYLTENWGLKVVSLLLAVGFWFYAVAEESIEVSRNIALEVVADRQGLSIANQSTEFLYVRLRAHRSLLSVLSAEPVSAYHKITGAIQAGEFSFRLEASDIKLPSDEIRVVGIFPEIVTVTIDETIVKKLAVEPNFQGEAAFGYKVLKEKIRLDPNAILVEGPKAQLSKMDSVKTKPIELVGRTQSFRKLLHVILPPNLRASSETIIDVFVPIREELSEKAFAEVPVKPLGIAGNELYVDLETEVVSFELKGPKSELGKLAESGVFVYVEVSELGKGTHEVPVTFVLPEAVSLKGEVPIVNLRVQKIR